MNHELNKYALRTAFCAKYTTNYKAHQEHLFDIPGYVKSVGTVPIYRRTILYIENQCLYLGRNWVLPTPRPQTSVSPPSLDPKGGEQHSLAGEGVGGTQFGRLYFTGTL